MARSLRQLLTTGKFPADEAGAENWRAPARSANFPRFPAAIYKPWAYLRDVLTLLPGWPKRDVLQLAPKFWHETRQQPETQQRLAALQLLGRSDQSHPVERRA